MNRLAFLRRMALAAASCAFIDVPWPKELPARIVGFPSLNETMRARLRAIDETVVREVFVSYGGNDQNDGLSPRTAVMSMDRAHELLPRGGTVVLLA